MYIKQIKLILIQLFFQSVWIEESLPRSTDPITLVKIFACKTPAPLLTAKYNFQTQSKLLAGAKFLNRLIFRQIFVRNLTASKLFGLIGTTPFPPLPPPPQLPNDSSILGNLIRFEYEYKIEYKNNYSILVFRLHIITTHTHLIP